MCIPFSYHNGHYSFSFFCFLAVLVRVMTARHRQSSLASESSCVIDGYDEAPSCSSFTSGSFDIDIIFHVHCTKPVWCMTVGGQALSLLCLCMLWAGIIIAIATIVPQHAAGGCRVVIVIVFTMALAIHITLSVLPSHQPCMLCCH